MKRGRKPLPPEMRKPGSRIEGAAPRLEGRPDCPPHLDAVAQAKWGELLLVLEEMGTLSRTDADALALYCETYAKYRWCLDQLRSPADMVIQSAKGFIRDSPWVNMRDKLARECSRLLVEFGLTPSARSRVAANPTVEDDPLAAFLKAGKGRR